MVFTRICLTWFLLLVSALQCLPTHSTSLRKRAARRFSTQSGAEGEESLENAAGVELQGSLDQQVNEDSDLEELDAPALIKRVQDVQTLATAQQMAMQGQQQAMLGLEREQEILAERLASLGTPQKPGPLRFNAVQPDTDKNVVQTDPGGINPPEESADKKALEATPEEAGEEHAFLCGVKTNRSCPTSELSVFGFGTKGCEDYGKATCNAGQCECDAGVCANGHGRCDSEKKARLLPGTHTIEVHKFLGKFVHMTKDDDVVDFSGPGDPGHKGHWHVVVNNDDTVMMYTKEWGPDYFMSVETMGKKGPMDSWTKFDSAREASFEAFEGTIKTGGQVVYLKDVSSGLWLSVERVLGGNTIRGVKEFPKEDGAFIFHPPLFKEVKMKNWKSSGSRLWPMLPLLLLAGVASGLCA